MNIGHVGNVGSLWELFGDQSHDLYREVLLAPKSLDLYLTAHCATEKPVVKGQPNKVLQVLYQHLSLTFDNPSSIFQLLVGQLNIEISGSRGIYQ